MSIDLNQALDQAKAVAEPTLKKTANELKAQFLEAFGEVKDSIHRGRIEKLFDEAAEAKLKAFMAKDPEEQRKWARAFELKVMAMETYVLSAKIVADAKAASLVKEMFKQVLDALGSVALAVIKTLVTGLITGAINGLTGGVGGPLAAAAAGAVGALLQPGTDTPAPSV